MFCEVQYLLFNLNEVMAMLKRLIVVALVTGFSVPVAAQVTSMETSRPAPKPKDPNAKVCEKIEVTGSRLGSRRVCMTAADWAAQRQDHRNDIEKVQRNVGILNPG